MTPTLSLNEFSRQVVEVMPIFLREFMKREDNELASGVLSFPQMVALDHASHHERVTMGDLAKALSVRMSSATVLVDRLLEKGMLTRDRDTGDRRVVYVRITPKGRRTVKRIMTQKKESIRGIFSHVSAKERMQYLAVLKKVQLRFLKGNKLL